VKLTMECADCGRRGPVADGRVDEYGGVHIDLWDEQSKAWIVRGVHPQHGEPTSEAVCPRCQRERAKETPA
jgi:hypothetical protein